jgi:hypothetical protein
MNLTQYWIGVSAALGIGGIVGFVAGRVSVEGKMRAEYAESVEMLKHAFENAKTEAPVVDVEDIDLNEVTISGINEGQRLVELSLDHEPNAFVEAAIAKGTMAPHEGLVTVHETDYHKAIDAIETPVELFVSGGVNDYGVSYIEDSEFEEQNGFEKIRIDIMIDDHNPLFLMEGQQIDDWDKRLGDSILIDFFRLVPPGASPVLYVRNHAAGEDYEVVRVEP